MVRCILTDIEGTTSSISFVHDVLFPYSRERMTDFVTQNQDTPNVAKQIEAVATEAGKSLTTEQVVEQLHQWIDNDVKATPLKALQGMIWEEGYRNGDYQSHVYVDALRQLWHWKQSGRLIYVYSSGSVQAQKLFFGHTQFGNMTDHFRGYFDTQTGPKKESDSYKTIAKSIGLPPKDILFLSDIKEELDAAQSVGMRTIWVVRDGELEPHSPHMQVRNFEQIDLG